MADPADETELDLEPLFDYSRVQPAAAFRFTDDDLDCYPLPDGGGRKRKKRHDAPGKPVGKDVINLDEDDDEDLKADDDDDWLAPPPKAAVTTASRLEEDKTLQELRLKKQELASVAQSAERLLKEVSAKREFNNSVVPSTTVEVEPPKRVVERQKIVISIQDKDGQKQFRIYKDDTFERLFKMYADKVRLALDRLVFSFDGDKVGSDATPDSLGMEDDDMLEVNVKGQ